MFPGEFVLGANSELFCNICSCTVKIERKSSVIKHRSSKKHLSVKKY